MSLPSQQTLSSLSPTNDDQIRIFKTSKDFFRVYLKEGHRCEKCIEKGNECCIIPFTPTLLTARCTTCYKGNGIHGCRPNLHILEKYFPGNNQIRRSKTRIARYDRLKKKNVLPNTNSSIAASRTKRLLNPTFTPLHSVVPLSEKVGQRKNTIHSSHSNDTMNVDQTTISHQAASSSSSSLAVSQNSSTFVPFAPIKTSTTLDLVQNDEQNDKIFNRICDIERMLKCQVDNGAKVELTLVSVKALLRDLKQ